MAKSLEHAMWLMTLKDLEVIGTLQAPGWHNLLGLSPHPLFSIPCLFLHVLLLFPPHLHNFIGALAQCGRGREGVGKVPRFPVYYSSLLACSHFSETYYYQRELLLPAWGESLAQGSWPAPGF